MKTASYSYKYKKFLYLCTISLGLYSVFHIFFYQKVFDSANNVYENPVPSNIAKKFKHIKFQEASKDLGIIYTHISPNFPTTFVKIRKKRRNKPLSKSAKALLNGPQHLGPNNPEMDKLKKINPLNKPFVFPSVSIIDINQDGFFDIFFPQSKGGKNKLFLNLGGKNFKDVASQYGLASLNEKGPSSMAYFVDFNLDGHLDLLLTRWGCHDLFFGQGPNKPFIKKTQNLDGYCSSSRGVNFIDFNKDGILDIVFANYIASKNINKIFNNLKGLFIGNKLTGSQNMILQGLPGGKFKQRKDITFNNWKSFSHTIGILDFNNDGWDDLFFTNDYSSDEVWINQKGKNFKEATNKYLPTYQHGFSGMNSEVYDIDNDGILEIYITNSFKPPFKHTPNNLWQRHKKTAAFKQVSGKLHLGKCGFAWGAKFADIDNDGQSELMVVNGRTGQIKERGFDSFWYYSYEKLLTPLFLRKYTKRKVAHYTRYSSYEKSCLFSNYNGRYYNIANIAGIKDKLDGRGLAITDLENNGKIDYVAANVGARALVYKNKTEVNNAWIGFLLVNQSLKQNLIGSKLVIKTTKNQTIYKVYNPFHGYRSQNDPRIHIGLGSEQIKTITLHLPNKRKIEIEIKNTKINEYNTIKI